MVSEKASLILSLLLSNLHNSPLVLPRAAASSSHAPLITPMITLLISILPVPSTSRSKPPWRSGSCPRTNLRMHQNRQSRSGYAAHLSDLIFRSSALGPLVRVLKMGTPTATVNAACALLLILQVEDNKVAIGRSGVIPLLVNLLETGEFRAKKNASTALYSLCSAKENKLRAVQSGIMKPLVDKSAFVMGFFMSVPESKPVILVEEFRRWWRSWRQERITNVKYLVINL
ncbi:hypothetical protein DY000_02053791 [Brassica cretica]|uniref:Uncharacterized protein n=1 Tax=Brassica cretica TaxID=69181 RepID=A0ABQ7AHT1_BRACR|nr:hypothetical protein DY000_02053791 [Brassica cretica]